MNFEIVIAKFNKFRIHVGFVIDCKIILHYYSFLKSLTFCPVSNNIPLHHFLFLFFVLDLSFNV